MTKLFILGEIDKEERRQEKVIVVRALDVKHARYLVAEKMDNNRWNNKDETFCDRLYPDGKCRVILIANHA